MTSPTARPACITRSRSRARERLTGIVSVNALAPLRRKRAKDRRDRRLQARPADAVACRLRQAGPFDIIEGAQPPLRLLHLVVRETEICGLRLAGYFRRRMRENSRNSVRRPRCASLTRRNYGGFCLPGNRPGLSGLHGGGCRDQTDGHRSLASTRGSGLSTSWSARESPMRADRSLTPSRVLGLSLRPRVAFTRILRPAAKRLPDAGGRRNSHTSASE